MRIILSEWSEYVRVTRRYSWAISVLIFKMRRKRFRALLRLARAILVSENNKRRRWEFVNLHTVVEIQLSWRLLVIESNISLSTYETGMNLRRASRAVKEWKSAMRRKVRNRTKYNSLRALINPRILYRILIKWRNRVRSAKFRCNRIDGKLAWTYMHEGYIANGPLSRGMRASMPLNGWQTLPSNFSNTIISQCGLRRR